MTHAHTYTSRGRIGSARVPARACQAGGQDGRGLFCLGNPPLRTVRNRAHISGSLGNFFGETMATPSANRTKSFMNLADT